jgi:flagellar biosynthesis/type III secretory pathway protein FliH
MVQTLKISLERPVASVRILTDRGTSSDNASANDADTAELVQKAKALAQAAAAVAAIAAKLNAFFETEVRQHNQQIAKLAVEIARKVLVQEISQNHYKIETILQEALRNAPSRQGVSVRLNPTDAASLRKQEQDSDELFSGITIEPDPNVKPADCVVVTPKGLVESFTETHLIHIAEALGQA